MSQPLRKAQIECFHIWRPQFLGFWPPLSAKYMNCLPVNLGVFIDPPPLCLEGRHLWKPHWGVSPKRGHIICITKTVGRRRQFSMNTPPPPPKCREYSAWFSELMCGMGREICKFKTGSLWGKLGRQCKGRLLYPRQRRPLDACGPLKSTQNSPNLTYAEFGYLA